MNNIRRLREQKKISQTELANIIGVKQNTISNWENEKTEIDRASQELLMKFFNVSRDYLLGDTNTPNIQLTGARIPVFGHVAAGIPISAIEDIIDYEEITHDMAIKGEYFGLVLKGDSMEPRMTTGDVVIVRSQPTAETGDIAIVLIGNEEGTCKKIKKTPEGIMLISLNPAYEPMFYSNKQIEQLPITIVGKVVELRAKF